MNHLNSSVSLFVMLVALILGGLIGWGVTQSTINSGIGSAPPTVGIGGGPVDENAISDSVLRLNNLLLEHNNLIIIQMEALFDGKDTQVTSDLINTNNQELSDLMAESFGANSGELFHALWQDQIIQYALYTEGLKNNDKGKMDEASARLDQISVEQGDLFQNLNQNLDPEQVSSLMDEHIALTLSIMEAYAKDDQENVALQISLSNDQITKLAKYLSDRISVNKNLITPQS